MKMHFLSPCLPFPAIVLQTHTPLFITFTFFPLPPSLTLHLFVHLSFNFGLYWEVVKKPYEICMKDCEPRDWPHLPDSRVNERPHWIIPHNASGTKAQQLTLEAERERWRGGEWVGQGSGCTQFRPTVGQEAACSHTQLTYSYKNNGLWDRNNSLYLFPLSP